MGKYLSYEEIKKRVETDTNNEYTLLTTKEEYEKIKYLPRGKDKKIKVRHNSEKCNFKEYEVQPHNWTKGDRCSTCWQKKSHEEYLEEFNATHNGEYLLISKYDGMDKKITIFHNDPNCKNPISTKEARYMVGKNIHRCFSCYGSKKSTTPEFQQEVDSLSNYPGEYTVLSEYKTTNDYILLRHNCEFCNNHEWLIKPYKFRQGRRCPKCMGVYRKNIDDFKKEVKELTNDEYTVLSDVYINNKTKVLMRHNTCGHEWEVKPNYFISGTRCPKCCHITSKAVRKIYSILDENNINYESELSYSECRNERKLPFDFYLPEKELLIEYDGKQHFIPWKKDGDKYLNTIEYRHYNDYLKNLYCINNNLNLIRIPYTEEKNLDSILEKILSNDYSDLFYISNGRIQNTIDIYDFFNDYDYKEEVDLEDIDLDLYDNEEDEESDDNE